MINNMNTNTIIQIALATTGIINCSIAALFLFYIKRGNHKSNILLACIALVICLKLGFALVINIPHEWNLISVIVYYGSQSAYMAIGPLLFLYINSLIKKEISSISRLLIFTPTFLPFIYDVPLEVMQLYFLCFLISVFFNIKGYYSESQNTKIYKSDKFWINTFFISFVCIWLTVNLLLVDFKYYFFELSVICITVFYINFYIGIKQYWIIKADSTESLKYKNSTLTLEVENDILIKLKLLMQVDKQYLDPDISLPKVSNLINCKPHILSQVINQKMNMTFNEYINSYRINEIKNIIKLPEYQEVKISSLAFDYGFNSISSFNTAFKKFTDLTPSQYKKA